MHILRRSIVRKQKITPSFGLDDLTRSFCELALKSELINKASPCKNTPDYLLQKTYTWYAVSLSDEPIAPTEMRCTVLKIVRVDISI